MAAIQKVLISGKLFSFQRNLQMGEIDINNKKPLSSNLHKINKKTMDKIRAESFFSAPLSLLNQKCTRDKEDEAHEDEGSQAPLSKASQLTQ